MALQRPQILDLDKLNVYQEEDYQNPQFFTVKNLPNILTYGKHYFNISYQDSINLNLRLKESSKVLFEFKDKKGNVIFSDLTDKYDDISGAAIGYVWMRKKPLRIAGEIADGIGHMTVVGELEGVPQQWKGVYNVRLTIPIEIRKEFINRSPILFQSLANLQNSSSFTETVEADSDSALKKIERSYINISSSHMDTYGGQVSFIELSYKESRGKASEFNVLTTYQLTGSKTNFTSSDLSLSSSFDGLNPSSHLYKFPTPTDIRRNGSVEFKLRFMNPNMEVAQNLSTGQDIEISGSITNFTGSKILVDSSDGIFITGSGALFFGSDKENGFRYEFKPKGQGKDTDRDTLEFVNVLGGVDKKSITIDKEGGINTDADRNTKLGSSGSGTVATSVSEVSKSDFSVVVGGISSSIKESARSTIVGGLSNKIELHNHVNNTNNSILGSVTCAITKSRPLGADNIVGQSSIIASLNSNITPKGQDIILTSIIAANSATIQNARYSLVLGGSGNFISGSRTDQVDMSAVIGGSNCRVIHDSSVIIAKSNFTSTDPNTVFVDNLDVAGSLTVNEITASIVSSSIIYSSGSNIFGDSGGDNHTFNGQLIVDGSGSIGYNGAFNSAGNPLIHTNGLYVSGAINIGTAHEGLRFSHDASLNAGIITGLEACNSNYNDLILRVSANNDLFISSSSGNVGIGTNNPTEKIHVHGNAIITGSATIQSHITTSGNISASGLLYTSASQGVAGTDNWTLLYNTGSGQVFYTASSAVGGGGGSADNLGNHTATQDLDLDGNSIKDALHITASGNISSSGTVTLASAVNFEGPAGATRYTFNNVTNTTNGATGYKLPFIIASGSDVGGAVVNISGSSGNAFVGIGTKYTDPLTKALTVVGDISQSGNFITQGHITSSGNILAQSEDARIRVEATAGNHPGFEWLEAGTRKWLIFNDPANDHMTWKNASNTELMELDQDGHLYVNQKIIHLGDTNTFIDFTTDDINFQAGGQNMIDLTSGSQSEITFNEAGIDIDFRVEGDSDTNLLFTNAGTDRVGIGTNAPAKKLTVAGDISASGTSHTFGGPSLPSGSKISIKVGSYASSSLNLTSANHYWDIAHSKQAVGFPNGGLLFRYNGNDKHVFDANGRLGIGKTAPTKTLEVVGEISSSEALFVQGTNLDFVVSASSTTELEVSGTISGVSASFGSTSNTTTRWTDGYVGNDEFIPIFPTDFSVSSGASRGHAVYTDTNGGTAKPANNTDNQFASKIIPKGYTAISGSLYGSDTGNTISFYSSSLTETSALSVSTDKIEAVSGTGSAFTPAIVGDGSKYVIIKWAPGSGDEIYGGKIYIKRT